MSNTIIVKWVEPPLSLDLPENVRTAQFELASWVLEDGLVKVGELHSEIPDSFNIRLVIPVARLIGLELSDG